VNIRVFDTPDDVARAAAARVAGSLADRPSLVLGLPAGRTPVGMYAELRRLHRSGGADFARATSFNLDEFVGLAPSHPSSFRTFMDSQLFGGINLAPERIHSLNGTADDLDAECERYDKAIDAAGGLSLQILGIGANGHIGFNEPGEHLYARTHRVTLADSTRRDNALLFGDDPARVPREALSMGMGTILKATDILLMATGDKKAQCVERAVREPITTQFPASFLQLHARVEVYLDRAAASLCLR
jgi:glucosamine-6-phosphate deaminase